MHLCYVDDSGGDNARTVTGLLIPAASWSDLLHCWLDGRRELTSTWGVGRHAELHANQLAKGRGRYCDTPARQAAFNKAARLSAYRIMLSNLARCDALTITTVAAETRFQVAVYRLFVAHLEEWAARADSHVVVIFDGKQGPIESLGDRDAADLADWRDALRNAKPYRDVHRSLPLLGRRVIEDPIMQDSAFSQLIQAADLTAYAAYQHLSQRDPQRWKAASSAPVARAYEQLAARWLPGTEAGVRWMAEDS